MMRQISLLSIGLQNIQGTEAIYNACADMKRLNQEVLRVMLLAARYRHFSTIEITKGTVNESLAHPGERFRPVIALSGYGFVLVHKHPSGAMPDPVCAARSAMCPGTRRRLIRHKKGTRKRRVSGQGSTRTVRQPSEQARI